MNKLFRQALLFLTPRVAPLIALGGFLLLYIPLGALVIYSFLDSSALDSAGGLGPSKEWTLAWYRKLAENTMVWNAFKISITVAFWSTLASTFLGTSAALALTRSRFPGRRVFDTMTYIPLIMPEIVLGLSLLTWFVLLHLTLGLFSLFLAHTTFSISYVIITVKARLQGFDQSLEEAAKDLGATPWKAFWKVTFPLISPGILSGALIAFTLSFDDFLVTYFTAGVGSDTLPLKIYAMIKFGVSPEINALSTIVLGATLILVIIFFKPPKKSRLMLDARNART